jgi:p-cumate 2,3-dioxygenase beta subunit
VAAHDGRGLTVELARADAEALLAHEAELLDRWRLLDWAALFSDDGEYQVPSPDRPDGEPGETLYLVDDDRHRLGARARRLLDADAHAEQPRSRCCRIVANVRLVAAPAGLAGVACAFVLHRAQGERLDVFPGHASYWLRAEAGGWRIRRKRAVLALPHLRHQGMLSLIL